MRSHPRQALPLALLAVTAAAVLIAAGGRGSAGAPRLTDAQWRGLAGAQRPKVAVGQRMIVVLNAPALANRVEGAGGFATAEQERRWTDAALAAQKLLISRLAVQGVQIIPEFNYTRTLNGFSAALDARALTLLDQAPDVLGVFPVRAVFPATLPGSDFAPGLGHRPDIGLSSVDGRGVTVALLDTGVDRAQPFLRGRITGGIDVIGGADGAVAGSRPDDPGQLERHGTEMAGLVVGAGGPLGLSGVAPGASVLPIRVAGWQRDATGRWAVYGRTDQLVAGLERAVDPNADGDAHDAARIALVAMAEPFAAFADGPLARAVAGALRLDTLVVAAAGNDGAAGPAFGSLSGPAGAPAALAVGAADLRVRTSEVRVVLRAGLDVVLDRMLPLAGLARPGSPLDLRVAAPRGPQGPQDRGGPISLERFFDPRGLSLVAGRAALVPVGPDPAATVANAAAAGAVAVVLFGTDFPAGGLGLDESVAVPAVAVPPRFARTLLAHMRAGAPVTLSLGAARTSDNPDVDRVARFSSTGLAFDGRVKPELVAPGVGLGTAEPGTNTDGSPRFGTVNGSSAAAAIVAGSAALLAQARPALGGEALKSLLVGAAQPLETDSVTTQGAGLLDVGGAAAAELTALPVSLALPRVTGRRWRARRDLVVQNVSSRRLVVTVEVQVRSQGAAAIAVERRPKRRVRLAPGESRTVQVSFRLVGVPSGDAPVTGDVVLESAAGPETRVRVPWAVTFGPRKRSLLGPVQLSARTFEPSDVGAARLTFVAGAIPRPGRSQDVVPLSRLDLELFTAGGDPRGLLARLRDVLPGRYQYLVTGRDPAGKVLEPGNYWIRLVAFPTDGGRASARIVPFTIK